MTANPGLAAGHPFGVTSRTAPSARPGLPIHAPRLELVGAGEIGVNLLNNMKRNSNRWRFWAACLPIIGSLAAFGAEDVLKLAPAGMVRLGGHLGAKIGLCVSNCVMNQDAEKFIRPFREKKEVGDQDWRCEYWGKWFTSAALAYNFEPSPEHRAVLDAGAHGLMATAADDGYIGTRAVADRLKGWDVWGRKYVLLGLIAQFDSTGDKAALEAARRHEDTLIAEVGGGKTNIADLGYKQWKGLPPCSVLEPTVLLYERTGEKKYLDFANEIVASWSRPSALNPRGMLLIEDALAGKTPAQIDAPKAYEMMSCYEGLCELYRATGTKKYLEAGVKLADGVIAHELTIIGSASSDEIWKDCRMHQTEKISKPMETCVTATWMKFCTQLLRLTSDPKYADELERSLYNALLSAQTPDGNWWAYFSALSGERVASYVQHADCGTSCCVLNGPRGLLQVPAWAVMSGERGPVVNLYCDGNANIPLHGAGGNRVKIIQETDYPAGGKVKIYVVPGVSELFTLSLRIPAWSEKTSLSVNGEAVEARPGTYARIERQWRRGDKIEIEFDMKARVERDPAGKDFYAICRGPVVLALDRRLCGDATPGGLSFRGAELAANPKAAHEANAWMAFDAKFATKDGAEKTLTLCDYSSAGTTWDARSAFRVWLPNPLDLATAFNELTPWQMMTHTKDRPGIPPAGR